MALPANRPAAVAAQTTTALDDERRAALGTTGDGRGSGGARAGNEDLSFATAVPVDGNSLAAELVRELVRSFHISRCGTAGEVDRFADRGVNVALKRGLHSHVRGDVDLVRRREAALDVDGDI